MKAKSNSCCFLSVAATLVSIPIAGAAVILDTTSNKTATLSVPGSSSSLATGPKGWTFTLSSGWNISDVSWGLYGNSAGTATVGVRIYSGSSASGTILKDTGTTTINLNSIGTAQYYDWTGLSWSLGAGTYTLAAYGASGTASPRIAVTSETLLSGAGVSSPASTQSGNNYAVLLQGTSVPEPGTWTIAACFVAGAAFVRKR